jgi:hypothetical protein
MRTLLLIVGVIVALVAVLVAVVLVIGSRLPPQHVASRSIRLKKSPADVYNVIHDFAHAPQWRSDVKNVEMLGTVNGQLQFREHGSNGTVTYELLADQPNQGFNTRIVDRDLGYSGQWEYVIVPTADGSLLTITERGEVSNLIFRFMSRYIFGHTATMDGVLKALAQHFGESAVLQDGPQLPK